MKIFYRFVVTVSIFGRKFLVDREKNFPLGQFFSKFKLWYRKNWSVKPNDFWNSCKSCSKLNLQRSFKYTFFFVFSINQVREVGSLTFVTWPLIGSLWTPTSWAKRICKNFCGKLNPFPEKRNFVCLSTFLKFQKSNCFAYLFGTCNMPLK